MDERRQNRYPVTRACAPHPATDEPHLDRHPATRACAHHHAADEQPRHRPSTTACAPRPATDERHPDLHHVTTACPRHHARADHRPRHEHPTHDRRRAGHAEHRRTRAHTAASHHPARAVSATIRGPGPRAGCLDRMSRSLCSCRPDGPMMSVVLWVLRKPGTRLTGATAPARGRRSRGRPRCPDLRMLTRGRDHGIRAVRLRATIVSVRRPSRAPGSPRARGRAPGRRTEHAARMPGPTRTAPRGTMPRRTRRMAR
jgi:hypothetical protein